MRLRRLEPVLRRALKGPCRIPRGSRVLVALSGGADSTALVLALRSVAGEFGVDVCAAHLHHGLRGRDADLDLAFTRDLCLRHGIPFVAARWDTRRRMGTLGLSGENGLRVLRRRFLAAAARRLGAGFVATAHTADDQLETLLLRLARGTGLDGLSGMRPRAGFWLKPLLEATRRDVEADLARIGQPWRVDGTNHEPLAARNRIRREVLPALARAVAPGGDAARVRATLARNAVRATAEVRAAGRLVGAMTRRRAPGLLRSADGTVAIDCAGFRRLRAPLATRLLRSAFRRAAPAGPGLTARHQEALLRLVQSTHAGGRVLLPDGVVAVREKGTLRLAHSGIQPKVAPGLQGGSVPLPVPGSAAFAGIEVRGGWTTGPTARKCLWEKEPSEEYFAAGGISGALEVRRARADETFVPFGRRRPVRVREFLRRQPVREHRNRPTVLADARGILWVVGVRRSARAPVSPATRRVLRVHVERHDREPGRSH